MSTVILSIPPQGFDSVNPAGLIYTNAVPQLLFDDTTSELVFWAFRVPADFSSAPILKVQYSATSAITGTFGISVSIMAVTPGDAADADIESYDAINSSSGTVPATTAGRVAELSLPLATNDSMAAGDLLYLRLARNVGIDTAVGDIEVRAVSLEYTAV